MTLTEIVQEVYNITGRPDLVNETSSAIKAATLKMHNTDFYARDLYETGIEFLTDDFHQTLDVVTIPRFRALKYLRKWDTSSNEAGTFLTVIDPEEALDGYSQERTNVCYLAGSAVDIKSSTSFTRMLIGCYRSPDVTTTSYSSWIAEHIPFAIIYEAVRVLFKIIGQDDQAAQYDRLGVEQFAMVKITGLSAVGY
jgi:hypothetical protein